MDRQSLIPVLAFALLTACAGEQTGDSAAMRPLSPDFGNAIRHNEAVQIIDPEPAPADVQAPTLDGRRAASAMARYQNGEVRALEIERTADSGAE